MVADFFRNGFQSIKSESTDSTNLTNLKVSRDPFFNPLDVWNQNIFRGLCPIITKDSRENDEVFQYFYVLFLTIWDWHFQGEICKPKNSFQPKHLFLLHTHIHVWPKKFVLPVWFSLSLKKWWVIKENRKLH